MTPEQRLNRLERVVKLMINAGLRARKQSREQSEKINILIHSQMELGEYLKGLAAAQAASHVETKEELKSLAVGQAKTDEALRRFINSLRRGRNGKTHN